MAADYQSWGRNIKADRKAMNWRKGLPDQRKAAYLPFGNGKSYGDSCHNNAGVLLDNRSSGRILEFDAQSGLLRAEAGILLCDILAGVLPCGWFLPVTPGTQFVTLGGAIANDVHGKNHHRAGTFGCHVQQFEIARSDQPLQICSRDKNGDLFSATIGGLGLTGNITWAEISLKKIASADIDQQVIKFARLEEYFALAASADRDNEYSVAWIDSHAKGGQLGRGHLLNGNHADNGNFAYKPAKPLVSVPFTPPIALINGVALQAFNWLYYNRQCQREVKSRPPYGSYFYPLDIIGHWNRLYGPKGLFQHQSIVPVHNAEEVIASLLKTCQQAHQGSFLTVLKRFGNVPSPGLMSFPREGFTLTLDFPDSGAKTLALLDRLDEITIMAGGAVNPYKDARMAPDTFSASFPSWQRLEQMRDPAIMSDFWRRVTPQ